MNYPEDVERYRRMQKKYYTDIGSDDAAQQHAVVGCFEEHEKYPYEQYLLADIAPENLEHMVALDFGCGPGRMIRRLAPLFKRVDGVDISPNSIEAAERWTAGLPNKPVLYVNDGVILNGVPDETYDFVYSTIAFHHINSHYVRMSLLREFHRVLKPGGKLAIQMFYTTSERYQWSDHCDWRESNHEAGSTNGYHDVRITPDNLPQVKEDFAGVGFPGTSAMLAPYPPPPHPRGASETDWIFLYARKPNPSGGNSL